MWCVIVYCASLNINDHPSTPQTAALSRGSNQPKWRKKNKEKKKTTTTTKHKTRHNKAVLFRCVVSPGVDAFYFSWQLCEGLFFSLSSHLNSDIVGGTGAPEQWSKQSSCSPHCQTWGFLLQTHVYIKTLLLSLKPESNGAAEAAWVIVSTNLYVWQTERERAALDALGIIALLDVRLVVFI